MHVAFMSVGGVLDDVALVYDLIYNCLETSIIICDCFDLLFTTNRIVYLRLRGIALLD
jgi:NADH:ubiquinone oxidoreductase subunit D